MTNDAPDAEDLSVQEWLYQISYQLEQQNQLLRESLDVETEESEPLYECEFCGEKIPKSDREQHMKQSHGMPKGVSYEDKYMEV